MTLDVYISFARYARGVAKKALDVPRFMQGNPDLISFRHAQCIHTEEPSFTVVFRCISTDALFPFSPILHGLYISLYVNFQLYLYNF